MVSVMIAPPISAPRSIARKVTTGMSELRKVWTPITWRWLRPLALAVRT